MREHYCCYIGPKTGLPCGNEAEWQIWSGPHPDDLTESCTRHVGEMLTDAPEHRIYPVEQSMKQHSNRRLEGK